MHRRVLLALWFCFCAAAQETAAVNGVAVNTQTGELLAGVQVHFAIRVPEAGMVSQYGALTGKDGRFSVSAMRPGAYFVMAKHLAFVTASREGSLVTLASGQHLDGLRVELTPRALISGRVMDEAGDPVAKAVVRATAVSGDDWLLAFNGIGAGATDDRGQYRMSVPPGKFYIYANVPAEPSDEPEEIRTDGTVASVKPLTFYPSATSQGGAAAVETVSGRETNGIDIRMAHPVKLSLSGTVTGTPGGSTALVNVNALIRQGNSIYDIPAAGTGSFIIPNLEQGVYYLYAYTAGEPNLRSAMYEFTLTDSAVSGIELALRPSFEITGTLQMAEGAGSPANRAVRLEMLTNFNGDSRIGAVNSEGVFQVNGVDPERYRVVVRPLPENGYVKAVWLDGTLMPHGVLDLRRGGSGSRLKIAVAIDAAQISGRVEGWSGSEIAVLMAEGDERGEGWTTQQPASDGTFTFKSVAPGKYRLFAIDTARSHNKEALDGMAARVEWFDVQPNDRLTRNLKVLTEAGDAKK